LYQYDVWYMSLYVGDCLVCRFGFHQTCIPDGHLHTVTYTRRRIDTINSPDDEHMSARNMYRFGINVHEKRTVRQVGHLQEQRRRFAPIKRELTSNKPLLWAGDKYTNMQGNARKLQKEET